MSGVYHESYLVPQTVSQKPSLNLQDVQWEEFGTTPDPDNVVGHKTRVSSRSTSSSTTHVASTTHVDLTDEARALVDSGTQYEQSVQEETAS